MSFLLSSCVVFPVRYQASDSATILAMIREGLGITLMPRMMLPKKLEVVVALPLDSPHQLQIGLANGGGC